MQSVDFRVKNVESKFLRSHIVKNFNILVDFIMSRITRPCKVLTDWAYWGLFSQFTVYTLNVVHRLQTCKNRRKHL